MSMTPPLNTNQPTTQPGGAVEGFFHRWLSTFRKNALQLSEWTVSLGAGPLSAGTFTITDKEINEASRVFVMARPDDENAMEPIYPLRVTSAAGSAVVEWEAPGHGAHGSRSFWYGVSG